MRDKWKKKELEKEKDKKGEKELDINKIDFSILKLN